MRDLVEFIARALVADPDAVRVDEVEDGGETVLEVRVAPDDLGRVIGRSGRTASALRTVVGALAGNNNVRVDIVDTDRVR